MAETHCWSESRKLRAEHSDNNLLQGKVGVCIRVTRPPYFTSQAYRNRSSKTSVARGAVCRELLPPPPPPRMCLKAPRPILTTGNGAHRLRGRPDFVCLCC
ncbi:hypothetical protein J6590_085414 [Homalodisca vitripennis]|nr:hypothetical protein J6590_085414 [Homalodisca vitripennis]